MSEPPTAHHKIKAEWTKSSKHEFHENSSSDSDKLEIVEENRKKVTILEDIIIPSQKSAKCHFCDKNFDKSTFEEHLISHEKVFFHCTHEDCDKKFKRKSSLRKHSYSHKGKFKYSCDECNVRFIDLTKFETHKITKHKTSESGKFHCQLCEKTFATADYLKRHHITHNDEYKYKCPSSGCDQKFKWLTSLQIHQTIHTQNKAIVECPHCLKTFFNQRTLERHLKIHKNIKFKCGLCEKVVSNRKDNIRRHIRHLHTEIVRSEVSGKILVINGDVGDEEDTTEILKTSQPVTDTPELPQSPPSPQPAFSRVNVIQSIGNPNKHCQVQVEREKIQETPQPADPPLPQPAEDHETELKLPPKKKPIASTPPTEEPAPAPKPKYDPIQHYRKILLGFAMDEDHPTTIEDNTEEEEIEQETETEPQVFPVHWRKRTSQNFLFRR